MSGSGVGPEDFKTASGEGIRWSKLAGFFFRTVVGAVSGVVVGLVLAIAGAFETVGGAVEQLAVDLAPIAVPVPQAEAAVQSAIDQASSLPTVLQIVAGLLVMFSIAYVVKWGFDRLA